MQNSSYFKKTLLATLIGFISVNLISCGGESKNGSGDSPSQNNIQMSGAVVDDYVAYSLVYVDVNKNGQFDTAFEPFAVTDKEGYFSKSKDGTDYCALPPTDKQYQYCLRIPEQYQKDAIIRIESGRDKLTTQRFKSTLSLMTDGHTNNLSISPMSTSSAVINNIALMQKAGLSSTEISTIQNNFKTYLRDYLNQGRLTLNQVNPLNFDNYPQGFEQDRAFKFAVQIHKIAETIAHDFAINGSSTVNEGKIPKYIPMIYLAILKNLPITNVQQDAFKSPTFISTVVSDAKIFIARVIGDTISVDPSGKVTTLAKYLNCTLANDDDNLINTSVLDTDYGSGNCNSIIKPLDTPKARKKLYAAELGTKYIIKNTPSASNLDKAKEPATTTVSFDIYTNDFNAAETQVKKDQSPIGSTVKPITDTINTLTSSSGSKALQAGNNTYATFDAEGNVTMCQDSDKVQGTYEIDSERDYITYIHYSGSTATIKNLDPTSTACTDAQTAQSLSGTLTSCMFVSYPDLADEDNNPNTDYIEKFVLSTSSNIVDTPSTCQ